MSCRNLRCHGKSYLIKNSIRSLFHEEEVMEMQENILHDCVLRPILKGEDRYWFLNRNISFTHNLIH